MSCFCIVDIDDYEYDDGNDEYDEYEYDDGEYDKY
jgi:hypothetical protein